MTQAEREAEDERAFQRMLNLAAAALAGAVVAALILLALLR